ncbi:importin subunit alpha-1, putative [Entamoeba dispar SAW760]|uniref:Importin subunit alpha-1, putative n=1 Tax=Entamoeba dispar (strain ATCC PRA-260 / SAW760) TaxID=370354 RepID=B0EMF8_ENTDS|nr:importin subunit alpha-1, putative [Entamoeba dispar SAW760]EDR24281.1 importin subunit alpha-1, putative [Entamoeba dispar SAW760]|eukprot:EDR24281.1 importin subunit alpha-1, putative [Entamoeba dispar SAW760]
MYRKSIQNLSEVCNTNYSIHSTLRQNKRKEMLELKRKNNKEEEIEKIKINSEEKYFNVNDKQIQLLLNGIQSDNYEIIIESIKMLKEIVKKAPEVSNEFESRIFDMILMTITIPRMLQIFQKNIDNEVKMNILYILVNVSSGNTQQLIKMIQLGVIEQLLPFMLTNQFKRDICWVFANLASENIKLRDEVMNRIINILIYFIKDNTEQAMFVECTRLVSNLCLFTPKPSYSIFTQFAEYLIYAATMNDSMIVSQALLGLDYLCEDTTYCQNLKKPLLPLFIKGIKSGNEEVMIVVLQCIGTLISNDNEFAQELVNNGFINEMIIISDYTNDKITPTLMYCLSNIIACKQGNAASIIVNSKLFKNILVEINTSPIHEIVIESGWVLINILAVLNDDIINKILNIDVFDSFYRILSISYGETSNILHYTLKIIIKILEIGEKESHFHGFNCYQIMLEESNCVGLLDGMKEEDILSIENQELLLEIEKYWEDDNNQMELN